MSKIADIIKQGKDKIHEVLTPENVEKYKLSNYEIKELIEASGEIEKYLKPGILNPRYSGYAEILIDLIEKSGNKSLYEQILTQENVKKYKLSNDEIKKLIEASGEIEKYLKLRILDPRYSGYVEILIYLIEKSGNKSLYEQILTPEMVEAYQLKGYIGRVTKMIIASGKIDEYLEQPELLSEMRLSNSEVSNLIKEKIKELPEEEKNKYYFEGQDIKSSLNMSNVIKAKGPEKIIEYLNPELLLKFNIANDTDITNLIKETGKAEEFLLEGQDIKDEKLKFTMANVIMHLGKDEILKYITPENLYRFNIKDNKNIANLINATGNVKMFLFDGEELTPNYEFTMANIIKGQNLCPLLDKEQINTLCEFDNIEIMSIIFSLDATKQKDGIHILKELGKSNSAELRRIKNEVAMQILEKAPEEYNDTLKKIEDIYLTSNVPNAAKRFMVFRELHPNYLGEDSRKKDASIGNIPSLKEASGQERSHIISSFNNNQIVS